jgi:tRNA dimethylallyltransferase
MMKPIFCIAGPTASGKSAYAVKLAKKHDGEVINADALQVYKELHVLSARPNVAEMQNIPHHMFGHVSVRKRYSTGEWVRCADDLIIDILARGKSPILVGGTGLYFKALTQGLAHIPTPSEDAVARAQALLDQQGIAALRETAKTLDPVATARVLGHDPQRLLRIVNVAWGTQKPLSHWQKDTKPVLPPGTWQGQALLPDRQKLYDKIDARFGDMIRNGGGFEEAKSIFNMGLDDNLPAMKAIGVRELIAHIRGEMSLDEAIALAQRETRRFAKRQFTWLRGQMADWEMINI